MNLKLDARALSLSVAVVASGVMLLLGLLGRLGYYEGAVEMMIRWHLFFSLSATGVLGGMIEAFVLSLALVYPTAYLYNRIGASAAASGA